MKIFLPDWNRERLERTARRHADALSIERGGPGCDSDDTDRLVVNLLRHEFTTYDWDPTEEMKREACLAIKSKYPWLAEECDRQIFLRALDEATEASIREEIEAEKRARTDRRQERSAASAKAIAELSVGMAVSAYIRGHRRIATITEVRRRRMDVSYSIKSGAQRTDRLYASEVVPLSDHPSGAVADADGEHPVVARVGDDEFRWSAGRAGRRPHRQALGFEEGGSIGPGGGEAAAG
ncbi:MAG: hypothetical protein QOD62_1075 [Actinomycetota bacterium]|nr:hypothetical protein [Actinomycetota bacterium]